MLITRDYPKLKGFEVHGVRFASTAINDEKGDQGIGSCPFCGSKKFYASSVSRLWDCKKCGLNGGYGDFLKLIGMKNEERFKGRPADILSQDRGIKKKTLRRWGVGWDGSFYTIPIPGPHSLMDLKIYQLGKKMRSSPGAKGWMFGYDRLIGSSIEDVYLCEGEWDAMVMDEILTAIGREGIVLGLSASFPLKGEWLTEFRRKKVVILYDNDDAGRNGGEKLEKVLKPISRDVTRLIWPDGLAEGFDLRDLFKANQRKPGTTFKAVQRLLYGKPKEKVRTSLKRRPASPKRMNREDVLGKIRQWLHLPDPEPLDVVFGSILSNRIVSGDPVWLFLVSPPGGSKSAILMGLNDVDDIFTTTCLTPHSLISGANFTGGGDPSLIPKLNNKVLVVKDFTAILSMNQSAREEILGIFRDAYDGRIEKYFGNGVYRSYDSRFGFIAGVTPAIELFNRVHTSLGERFLRYRIPCEGQGNVDAGTELISKAIGNIYQEEQMRTEIQDVVKKALDVQVNVKTLPTMTVEYSEKLIRLAQWIASLRAIVVREKYSNEILYRPVAEVGTRLAKQLGKLSYGIGLYRGVKELGPEEYKVIVKIARDTCPDRVEELMRILWTYGGKEYLSTTEIANRSRLSTGTCRILLQDLTLLNILEKDPRHKQAGGYRIKGRVRKLMGNLEIYEQGKEKKK